MLLSEMAAMRIWSKARVKKAAKVLQKGTVLLRVAQPTAMLTWRKTGQLSLRSGRSSRAWGAQPLVREGFCDPSICQCQWVTSAGLLTAVFSDNKLYIITSNTFSLSLFFF